MNGIAASDINTEDVYSEMQIAQDRIVSDASTDYIIKIPLKEGIDTYPLSTDEGENPERKNIAAIKVLTVPEEEEDEEPEPEPEPEIETVLELDETGFNSPDYTGWTATVGEVELHEIIPI